MSTSIELNRNNLNVVTAEELKECQPQSSIEYNQKTASYGTEIFTDGGVIAVHAGDDVVAIDIVIQDRDIPNLAATTYRLHPYPEEGKSGQVFKGFIPGLGYGDAYSLTVYRHEDIGGEQPSIVRRDNILDPYAMATTAPIEGYHGEAHRYSSIVDPSIIEFTERPNIDPASRVIYETHIKGMTMLHPDVPEELRGKYLGLCHPAVIEHLKKLGITSLEVMPPHRFSSNRFTLGLGKSNYFGYGTDGFHDFHDDYAVGTSPEAPLIEFNEMVKRLHQAGIEVIVDVVYNHTNEDNPLEILDHRGYYLFNNDHPVNHNGCSQSINAYSPHSIDLIISSMKQLAAMGVDGFRFDLLGAMTQDESGTSHFTGHPLLLAILNDPELAELFLSGEPWGMNGYAETAEGDSLSDHNIHIWWGKFRDLIREAFIQHKIVDLREWADYMSGSLKDHPNMDRKPNVVNLFSPHDGLSAIDTASYDEKHNHDNGEHNRDGTNDNRSNNHGYEGVVTPEMRENPFFSDLEQHRISSIMNAIGATAFANGTPMYHAGDEFAKTKYGNNNNWNQDNELSYINWSADPVLEVCSKGMRAAIAIRQMNNGLNMSRNEMTTSNNKNLNMGNLGWFNMQGKFMQDSDWNENKAIGMYVQGKDGNNDIFTCFNNSDQAIRFELPKEVGYRGQFALAFDAHQRHFDADDTNAITEIIIQPHSIVSLRKLTCEETVSDLVAA